MYRIHTDVMSDVYWKIPLTKSAFFKQAVLLNLFCSGSLYFFLLLNYQIIVTEKILKFVLKNLF